jgi:hypothetical protein
MGGTQERNKKCFHVLTGKSEEKRLFKRPRGNIKMDCKEIRR